MVWLVVGVASVSGAAAMQIKILFQPCLDKAGAAVGFNVCMYCTVRRSLVSSTGSIYLIYRTWSKPNRAQGVRPGRISRCCC